MHNVLANKEVDELYINLGIKSFAISLISVFIPIYFYILEIDIKTIFLLYAIMSFFHIIASIFSVKLSAKYGYKHLIILSQPFLIIFLILLLFLEQDPSLAIFVNIFYGIYSGTFWPSFHAAFSDVSDKGKKGSEAAYANILATLFSSIAPFVGGLIALYFGFTYLFLAAIIFVILSTIPLLLTKEIKEASIFDYKLIFKHKIKDGLGYFGYGLLARISGVVWPLILFLFILDDFASLGLITTVLLIFSLLSNFIVGKFFDSNKNKYVSVFLYIFSVTWFVKIFISTSFFAFVIDSIQGILKPSTDLSVNFNTYKNAYPHTLEFVFFREFFIHSGIIISMLIMYFAYDLYTGLLIAGIGVILLDFLNK